MLKFFASYLSIIVTSFFIVSFTSNDNNFNNSSVIIDNTFQEVFKIFKENCIECHSGDEAENGLKLTSYIEIMNGSENGKVIIPGDPDGSELVKRITGLSKPKMPLGKEMLDGEKINIIVNWIKDGAKDAEEIIIIKEETPVLKDPSKDLILYSDVKSIFDKQCIKCHMENGKMGSPPEGFNLTSYNNIFVGDERLRIVPGNPAASELLRKLNGKSFPQMPFDGPPYLTPQEINLIEAWILQGAKDENGNIAPSISGRKIRLKGVLTNEWKLDDLELNISGSTRIDKKVRIGEHVEIRGFISSDNEIVIERIKGD